MTVLKQQHPKTYSKIFDLNDRLAKRIKQYEKSTSNFPPIEVLNEVRYAFRASMELLNIGYDEPEKLERIYHALICAYHDLLDGLSLEINHVLNCLEPYDAIHLNAILGDKLANIYETVDAVNDLIAESRSDHPNRYRLYNEILYENYFDALLDIRKDIIREYLPKLDRLKVASANDKKQVRVVSIWIALATGFFFFVLGLVVS